MTGVATGFVIGQVLLTPPSGRGLMEEVGGYSGYWSVVLCSCLRYFLGLVVLVTAKTLAQMTTERLIRMVGLVAGVTMVCIKRKSVVTSKRVHYSTEFVALQVNKGGTEWNQTTWNCDKPLNIDIPVKFLSYTAMGSVAIAICAPSYFHWQTFDTQKIFTAKNKRL